MFGIDALLANVFFKSIFGFWKALPDPIKILIIIGLGILGGFVYGHHKGWSERDVICMQEKQASIDKANQVDQKAQETAYNNMKAEKEKWQNQSINAENKLKETAIVFDKMKEHCKIDETYTKFENDIDNMQNNKQKKGSK